MCAHKSYESQAVVIYCICCFVKNKEQVTGISSVAALLGVVERFISHILYANK